jgi:DNA repair protein RadA/Sms
MPKLKSKWICQECGFQAAAFLGRCTDCGAWNSMTEEIVREISSASKISERTFARNDIQNADKPVALNAISKENYERLSSGLTSLDEVLGGGIVPGAVILLAGEPGIGKSTLLLQLAKSLEIKHTILYVSAEESASQVSLRASRLGIVGEHLYIDTQQDVLNICEHIKEKKPHLVIVDSIQAIYHPDITSTVGSVSQVRQTAEEIINTARINNTPVIIVGHINKEGVIAGPKVLEHMVDVVLQFEGDKAKQLRILRAHKNRFGTTNEIAIFSMDESGLNEINHAGTFFLADHLDKLNQQQDLSPGTAIIAYNEGNQVLFLEVQALVGTSVYSNPRRVANGWDYNRLLQTIAVLEKKLGVNLSSRDVYVNVVGGMDFDRPCGDLGISAAILTSLLDRRIAADLFLSGEIGLTGEIRQVVGIDKILKEAGRLGFRMAIVPKANTNTKTNSSKETKSPDTMKIIGFQFLQDVFNQIIPGWQNDLKALRRPEKSGTSSQTAKDNKVISDITMTEKVRSI